MWLTECSIRLAYYVVLAGETLKTRIEFEEPKDRHVAHNTMLPNYRFGKKALEREGRVIDIQVTHETQQSHGSH